MEEIEEVSLNAIFKKKKSIRTKDRSTLRKPIESPPLSLPATTGQSSLGDAEEPIEAEGNVVVSRLSKKKSIKSVKSNSSPKARFSLDSHQDDAESDQAECRIETPRRKLLRPTSHASLSSLGDDSISASSPPLNTLAQASRPTYSTSHLNELKSLTLSPSPQHATNQQDAESLTERKFGSFIDDEIIGDDSFESQSFTIPTSSMINSAKERRSQARKTGLPSHSQSNGAAEDFISLSGTSSLSTSLSASKKGESRLVREEDELGEGEDEHAEYTGATDRVPLGQKAGMLAEAKKKAGMEAMILDTEGDIDEGNEEELEWEAAQIRRGGIGGSATKTTTEVAPELYRPASIPAHSALASFNTVESRLLKSLEEMQASLDQQSDTAVYFTTEREALQKQETDLRQEVEKEAARQHFFQEMNTFVDDINSFFTAKWPALEQVEKDLLSILSERTELVYKRRYEDFSDDLVLFKAGEVSVRRPVIPGAASSSQQTVDAEADDTVMEDGDDGVDELGRSRRDMDTSSQAPSRRARREERALRRKRRQMRDVTMSSDPAEEGYSTDDSLSPADSSDLLAASKALVSTSQGILADTANPEFSSPTNANSLSDRFLSWKARYPEEYSNAFGNLALVQVWGFWVRVELVSGLNVWGFTDWINQEDRRGLENWEWMRGLEGFDHKVSEGPQDDGQESVIAAMITTVIIPTLSPIICQTYDPFSHQATTKSLELVEQVGYVLDVNNNETYDQFVMSFLNRFCTSLRELKHLAGSAEDLTSSLQSQIGMDGIEARNRFLNKCYKLLKQGLRWRKHSKRLVFEQLEREEWGGRGKGLEYILSNMLVGQIMLPILLAGWDTGGQAIAAKMIKACPFGVLAADVSDALHGRR